MHQTNMWSTFRSDVGIKNWSPFLCFLIRSTKRKAIFWHWKTGTCDICNFRQSMLKDPQNGRAQNPSNTFTFWFESLYKSLKVSYHSFHKVNMSHGRNTRKIPDQVFQYPIIPDWLNIWCKYPYPIHTRTDPKYIFQSLDPIWDLLFTWGNSRSP